jgi:hypothetical protein
MKEEHIDKVHALLMHKREMQSMKKIILQHAPYPTPEMAPFIWLQYRREPTENVTVGASAYLKVDHFVKFLDGEIQALNLELHNLGVELPGVPQIEKKQPITKGPDQ